VSDPALDGLFEEIRANDAEEEAVTQALKDWEEAREALHRRRQAANWRAGLLARTLDKHIREQIPVLQAKMIVHEEMGGTDDPLR
jgi:hypothetical protein